MSQETIGAKKDYKVTLKSGLSFEFRAAGFVVDEVSIIFYECFWRKEGLTWMPSSPQNEFRKSEVASLHRVFHTQGDEMEFGVGDLFQ